MQTSGNNRPTWIPCDFVSLALTAVAVAVVTTCQIGGTQAQVIGTISPTNPVATQDGTAAHPYSDASQCPPSTDIVIWPEEWRSIPSIPREFAVCFVGGQSKNDNVGPNIEVRER
jgi:hypothetical protein